MNEGENKEILASKTPLYDANGEIRGLLGFFIDRELLTVNDRRGTEIPAGTCLRDCSIPAV